ncbi:class I SAM-dependent methyltransferase, partial [Klebsiella pneumoniae]|nr:class I SAM-dependent methyltransferase [Klebsiella pneumoniae]
GLELMSLIDNCHHYWNAEEYHIHSQAQAYAALELLTSFNFKGDEQVLDIGCGDGKITSAIANSLPNGIILGIDISQTMIEFAQKS